VDVCIIHTERIIPAGISLIKASRNSSLKKMNPSCLELLPEAPVLAFSHGQRSGLPRLGAKPNFYSMNEPHLEPPKFLEAQERWKSEFTFPLRQLVQFQAATAKAFVPPSGQ